MRFCLPWKNNNKCHWSMDILPRLVVAFTILVGWCTIEFHKASTNSRLSLIVICFFYAILFSLYKLCILVAWQIEQATIFAKSIACYIGLAESFQSTIRCWNWVHDLNFCKSILCFPILASIIFFIVVCESRCSISFFLLWL